MASRRCSVEGCRAWARRGAGLCAAHAKRQHEDDVPLQPTDLYAAYAPVVDLASAHQLPPADLRLEIALLRQAVAQLLAVGLPPDELIISLHRAASALVQMLKANKQLSEDTAGGFETVVEQCLTELGLGRGGA